MVRACSLLTLANDDDNGNGDERKSSGKFPKQKRKREKS
jgi:hypothetical protein